MTLKHIRGGACRNPRYLPDKRAMFCSSVPSADRTESPHGITSPSEKIHHLIDSSASVTWIQKASLNHNGLFLVHSTSMQNPQESVLLFFGCLFVLFFSS